MQSTSSEVIHTIHLSLKKAPGIVQKAVFLLPFSPFNGLVWRLVDKNSVTIIDVGCEYGPTARLIRLHARKTFIVGIDRYLPFLRSCKKRKLYDDLVLCDARALPFKGRSSDAVLALEVIEHLPKNAGLSFLADLEKIASRQVLVSTPVGFMEKSPKCRDSLEGELRKHRSGWLPREFEDLGYRTRGHYGPRFLPREMAYWISLLLPLTYFFPRIAHCMICIKLIAAR